MNKNTINRPRKESGSVVVFILIAVALFAALGFAVMRGGSGNVSMLTSEQVQTYMRQIVAYGGDMASAVKRMSLRGTADTAISFDNAVSATSYANAGCSKASCKVFDADGGGLNWMSLPSAVSASEWLITTGQITDVGASTDPELLLLLRNISLDLCKAINVAIDFGSSDGTPPQEADTINLTAFTGTYTATLIDDGANGFDKKLQGCFEGGGTPAAGTYHYYRVLLAR